MNTITKDVNDKVAVYYIDEAAAYLRMSVKSVRRQIERGHLKKCSKFGRVLIPRKEVETFFDRYSD